jgi:sugar-specific transcriptional regulator TrmB
MLNTKDSILQRLRLLNLSQDEARVYLELLKEPSTHLKLARVTGINRTKIYRLVDQLEKRSLIAVRTDDRGTFLIATDPATLEVELITQEGKLRSQRQAFNTLLPVLTNIKTNEPSSFIIHTYEGTEGFKQMLWHELKTEGQNMIFGCGSLNELVDNRRWIEKHQARTVEADYDIREIINPGEFSKTFSIKNDTQKRYTYRTISTDILTLENQIAIYNDTVSMYHWRQEQKVGLEIINTAYAKTMRQMFEIYWQLAENPA